MTIKHIVISGGGPTFITSLGSLDCLIQEKYLDIQNIESIYGTSAGALVGALFCLKFDISTIYDYIIKRPWHQLFPIHIEDILNAYEKKGIFDIKIIEKCLKPLLDAKDLRMDITLKEFYDYSKIEFHVFSFEINNFKLEDISYLTYPDMPLKQAVFMSCCIPTLLTPICFDDKCYVDGGFVCNYPLKYCVESGKNEAEILGLKNKFVNNHTNRIHSESTLLDLIMVFLFKTVYNLNIDNSQPTIQNEIVYETTFFTISELKTALSSMDERIELYNKGFKLSKDFLKLL